nr:translesion error-prone DNA polymerase V autoproteolytic subunit [Salinibacter ruber]
MPASTSASSEPTSTSRNGHVPAPGDSTGGLRVASIRRVHGGSGPRLPLYLSRVAAGFPSPADDYVERSLDLSEALVEDEEATFYVRVAGDSMIGAGIHDGDILVVDRSVEPEEGDVVIAALGGELTVKRYEVRGGRPCLVPEAEGHDPIPVREGEELIVWGVARHVVHEIS